MNKIFLLSVLLIVCITSCRKSKYETLIDAEMSKKIRYDSIFLGFTFGKPKADFFVVCKSLNEQKKVVQAEKYGFVEYLFPKKTKDDKKLRALFWGTFNDKKMMTGLKFEFSHPAWSPWNKEAQPNQLIPVVKNKFLEWFPGNDFESISLDDEQTTNWVKIDGNRRITIFAPNDISAVKATIDDLRMIAN